MFVLDVSVSEIKRNIHIELWVRDSCGRVTLSTIIYPGFREPEFHIVQNMAFSPD